MKRKLIYFTALILYMFISGLYLGMWFALIISLRGFSPGEFIHIVKVIVSNISLLMQIIMPLCIFVLLLCLWFYRYKRSTGFYLGLTSLFLLILALLFTLIVLSPIDKEIYKWSLSSLPPQWEDVRNKWQLFHGLLTLVSLLSYGCFSWFVLAAMRKNKSANY